MNRKQLKRLLTRHREDYIIYNCINWAIDTLEPYDWDVKSEKRTFEEYIEELKLLKIKYKTRFFLRTLKKLRD